MTDRLVAVVLAAFVISSNAHADFVSGDLQLRDAMYLYNQDLYEDGAAFLLGSSCDVFQLVLDIDSGATNLIMDQFNSSVNDAGAKINYSDKIQASAKMFSYTLYKDVQYKVFQFWNADSQAGTAVTGTGTVFGYCFSTDPAAYLYLHDAAKCINTYSDGSTSSVSGCTPRVVASEDSTGTQDDMSDLVGEYNQSLAISATSSTCRAIGASNGTYTATLNVTVSGSFLTLLGYTSDDSCHYTLTKMSGNSASGYSLSGTANCTNAGFVSSVSVSSLRKSGDKLRGSVVQSAHGCVQTMTLQ